VPGNCEAGDMVWLDPERCLSEADIAPIKQAFPSAELAWVETIECCPRPCRMARAGQRGLHLMS